MAVKRCQKWKKNPQFFLNNQKGVAVVEMLPLLAVFVILFGFTFGFWTSIHRGTLQSIAARHYAFEVINHRTHFVYHRDTGPEPPVGNEAYYRSNGYRFFAVVDKQPISSLRLKPEEAALSLFNAELGSIPNQRDVKVSPIWLKVGYGICINLECGGK